MKQLFGALDVDQLTDGLDQENLTGYFRAAKGKLYTSEKENSFSQDDHAEYTLENGVMKWTGGSSALISDNPLSPCGPRFGGRKFVGLSSSLGECLR